jgi:ribonuclease HII
MSSDSSFASTASVTKTKTVREKKTSPNRPSSLTSTSSTTSTRSTRSRKTYDHMQLHKYVGQYKYVVGIDEVARGCLAGRVYTAAVILPEEFPDDEYKYIRDSKTLSAKQREKMCSYIEKHAVAFAVDYAEVEEVDQYNILNATMRSMHRAVDELMEQLDGRLKPEFIMVDGPKFPNYKWIASDDTEISIPHETINHGDALYRNIAAASIVAKVYHDEYIRNTVEEHPEYEKYGWLSNMCYGTAQHIKAIREHGLTPLHRKSFGICKDATALETFRDDE